MSDSQNSHLRHFSQQRVCARVPQIPPYEHCIHLKTQAHNMASARVLQHPYDPLLFTRGTPPLAESPSAHELRFWQISILWVWAFLWPFVGQGEAPTKTTPDSKAAQNHEPLSGTCDLGTGNNRGNLKRRRQTQAAKTNEDNPGDGDSDEDGRDPTQSRRRTSRESDVRLSFACPFAKLDRQRYHRECGRVSFGNIHRVK
jgi:hypothetical protein